MIWLVVIALAGLYLLLRLVQMMHFFVNDFLLAPTIPLSLKVAVSLVMGVMVLGALLWWKHRASGQRTSGRGA